MEILSGLGDSEYFDPYYLHWKHFHVYVWHCSCQLNSETSLLEENKKGHIFLSALQSYQDSLPAGVQNLFPSFYYDDWRKCFLSVSQPTSL